MTEQIEQAAKRYTEYNDSVSDFGSFGVGCEDLTPSGKKAHATKLYNKFADLCEIQGMTLKEQTSILKKYNTTYT